MANEKINIDLLINASESAKTVKEVRQSLKDLKTAALQVEEGSEAFRKITQASGQLQDKIGDLQATTKYFANDLRQLEGFTSVAEGIAGGFALAQGAAALFGGENKQLEESLVKLTSVMSILQGLQAIGNVLQKESAASLFITNTSRKIAITLAGEQAAAEAAEAVAAGTATIAQRALNAAMNANPIGILITLILAGVAALALWSGKSEEATIQEKQRAAAIKAAAEEQKKYSEYIGKESASYVSLIQQLKNTNAGSKERKNLIADINKQYGTHLKNIKDESVFQNQLNQTVKDYIEYKKQEYIIKSNNSKIELNLQMQQQEQLKIEKVREEFRKKEELANKQGSSYRGVMPQYMVDQIEKSQAEIDKLNKHLLAYGFTINKAQKEVKKFGFEEDKSTKSTNDNTEAIDKNNEAYKQMIEGRQMLEKFYSGNNEVVNLRDNYDKLKAERLKQYNEDKELAIAAGKSLAELDLLFKRQSEDDEQKYNGNLIKIWVQGRKERNDLIAENDIYEKQSKLQKIQDDKKLELDVIDRQLISEEKKNKLKEEINKKYLKSEIDAINEAQDAESKAIEDKNKKEIAILTKQNEQLLLNSKKAKENSIKAAEAGNKDLSEQLDIEQSVFNEQIKLNIDTITKLNNDKNQKLLENDKKYKEASTAILTEPIVIPPPSTEDWINSVTEITQQMITLFSAAYNRIAASRISALDDQKDAELEKIEIEQKAYEDSIDKRTKAEKYKALKDEEYANKKKAIEVKYEREKALAQYKNEVRQWEMSLAQASVNLANAMIKALGNPFLLGTTAAIGALQIGVIYQNKPTPPKLAKGGLLQGPSHANGGIMIEAEGGEAIINKRSTQAYLPILNAINQAGGGTPLMNTFASGGVASQTNVNIDSSQMVDAMKQFLNQPIKAYVVSNEITSAQKSDNVLRNRTTF